LVLKATVKPQVVRRAYGKPWSDIVGEVGTNPEFLAEVGKIVLRHVLREARKDLALQGRRRTPRGEPEGIPADRKFFESFDYRVATRSQVEIVSTWPWIKQIIEGRKRYRMKWLTRDRGVGIVPLEPKKGTVIFRWAPKRKEDAWIHPGFERHNFVDRGFRKAKTDISKTAKKTLKKLLRKNKRLSLT